MKKIYKWLLIVLFSSIICVSFQIHQTHQLHASGSSTIYLSSTAANGGDGASPETAINKWEDALTAVPDGGIIEVIGMYSHRTPTILPNKSITLKGHEPTAAFYWGDYIEMNGNFTVDQIDFSNHLIGSGSMDAPYRSLYVNGYTFTMTPSAKSNANDGLTGEQRVLIYGGSESGTTVRGRTSTIQLNSGNYSHVFAYGNNHGIVEDGVYLYLDGTAVAASVSSDENTPFYVTINQPQKFSNTVGILDGDYGYIEHLTLNAGLQATPITKLKNVTCNSRFEITYPYTQTIEGNLTLDGNASLVFGLDAFSPASLYVKGKISGTGKLSNGFLYGSLRSDDVTSNPTLTFSSGTSDYDFVKKEVDGHLIWKSEKHVARIYVDEAIGSDSNDGTSASPLRSIPKALEIMKNGSFDTSRPIAITLLNDATLSAPLTIKDSIVMLDGQEMYQLEIAQDALITLQNSELQIEKSHMKFHGTNNHIQANDNSYLIVDALSVFDGQPNVTLNESYMEASSGEFGSVMQDPLDDYGSEVELGNMIIHGDLKGLDKITAHGRLHIKGKTTVNTDLDLSQAQILIADDDITIGGAIWGNRMSQRLISLQNGKQISADQILGSVSLYIDAVDTPIYEQTYVTLHQAVDANTGNTLVLDGMDDYHIETQALADKIQYQVIKNTDSGTTPDPSPTPDPDPIPNPDPDPEPDPVPEPMPDTESIIVTFEPLNDTPVITVSTQKDRLIAQPSDPMKTGYTFSGWYKEKTFVNRWDFTKDRPSQALTLYAKWIKDTPDAVEHVITLDTDGDGKIDTTTKVEPNSYFAFNKPLKKGHTFLGWYLDESLTQIFDPETAKITSDMMLYAKFTKEKYRITLDTSGGEELSSLQLEYQDTFGALPIPKRTGYLFKGWYINQEGKEIPVDSSMQIEQSMILYAKWKQDDISAQNPSMDSKDDTQTIPKQQDNEKSQDENNQTITVPTGDHTFLTLLVIAFMISTITVYFLLYQMYRMHKHR